MSLGLHIAIPAMAEAEYLPSAMAALLSQHSSYPYHLYICVNQPESYRQSRPEVCENNDRCLRYLKQLQMELEREAKAERAASSSGSRSRNCRSLHIIDKCSPGQGWSDKQCGVGWARKTLFEYIMQSADAQDIILSLDADTVVENNYCQAVGDYFQQQEKRPSRAQRKVAALPYYHPLIESQPAQHKTTQFHDETSQAQSETDRMNRAILRYEIYMRLYYLNLQAIHSPFAFTAIGSAMAFRVDALRKIGNIKPLASGEDFYLLQKFAKSMRIGQDIATKVMPATRFSDRVHFGTGPTLEKACLTADWSSYPLYHPAYFEAIAQAYQVIGDIYANEPLPANNFLSFLEKQFKDKDLWKPLRVNMKDLEHFTQAFHEKADGLRILQYLHQAHQAQQVIMETQSELPNTAQNKLPNTAQNKLPSTAQSKLPRYNEQACLQANLQKHLQKDFPYTSLEAAPTSYLIALRDALFQREAEIRQIQG